MNSETQTVEYKSLQKIRTGDKGYRDLAVTCVALANAQGGLIYVGYDDKKKHTLPGQTIQTDEVNDAVTRLRSLCFNVGLSASVVLTDETGSQYFIITVFPSMQSIASTSDGKYYMRFADKCEPVRSEDMLRLSEMKGCFQWEIKRSNSLVEETNISELHNLANEVRTSNRIGDHIRQMDDKEIAEHYCLIEEKYLTNLGVLWLGTAKQKNRMSYPITVQYIVYDADENKIRKVEWRNDVKNPKELLETIEKEAVELTYSYEFPNGLFRKQIRHYNPKVLRELLVNAIVHQSMTISSDIMIKAYPDRLEISNPGGLPLGVTKDNILHTRYRRNPHFIELMFALGLMEGEGSGYNLIYELNSMEVKQKPLVQSDFSECVVTQYAKILNPEILPLLDYVMKYYQLTQKDFTVFGIIAREQKMYSTALSKELQLSDDERLRSYTAALLKQGLILQQGVHKGSYYVINPLLIKRAKADKIPTTLKTVESDVLESLIIHDLEKHPQSSISEIVSRLPEVDIREVRKMVYGMVDDKLKIEGANKNRRYSLKQNGDKKTNKK